MPWTLIETILDNKSPFYTFQIGKRVDCLVSLETLFPIQKFDTDKYWFDQWKKETGLKPNTNDLIILRNEVENYFYIIVKSQNSIPVFYWIKSNQTDKWYLKMKTASSRHNGDFKEFIKILKNIQIEK